MLFIWCVEALLIFLVNSRGCVVKKIFVFAIKNEENVLF